MTSDFEEILQPPGQTDSGWCNSIPVQTPTPQNKYSSSHYTQVPLKRRSIGLPWVVCLEQRGFSLASSDEESLFSEELRSCFSCICWRGFVLFIPWDVPQEEGGGEEEGEGEEEECVKVWEEARPLGYLHEPVVPCRSEKHSVLHRKWIIYQQRDVTLSSRSWFPLPPSR